MQTRRSSQIIFPAIAFGSGIVLVIILSSLFSPAICSAQANCNPDYRRSGVQPFTTAISGHFDNAGLNRLGTSAPPIQKINSGFPQIRTILPYVPCVLLKAIGAVESAQTGGAAEFDGWKQFNANYGSTGTTVVGAKGLACGYGILQVTDGMNANGNPFPIGSIDPERVSREVPYNIGAGTIILINKWNQIPPAVGDNNPYIIEHWYFAAWAYNNFSDVNWPNHFRFPDGRGSWACSRDATQNEANWPYQEKVWGCMNNPPVRLGRLLWKSTPAALPPRNRITFPPESIPWFSPRNYSCTLVYLPLTRR